MESPSLETMNTVAFLSSLPISLSPSHPRHRVFSGQACIPVRQYYDHHRMARRGRVPHRHMRFQSAAAAPTASLADWLLSNKATINENLALTPTDSRSKLGLYLTKSGKGVLKNTELASFPESVFLSSKTARSALEAEVSALKQWSGADDLAPASWIALQLLYERAKGDGSSVAPLIKSIPGPEELDAATLWPSEQLEWLKGSPVYDRLLEIARGVQEEWERINSDVGNQLFQAPQADFPLDLYRWAIAVVDARSSSVSSGKELIFAPVASQMNTAVSPSSRLETGSGGMFFSSKRKVKLVSQQELKPGDELTLYAGASVRNADLLVERGMILPNSSANTVEMVFALTTMDRFYEDKVEILEQYGDECGIPSQAPAAFDLAATDSAVWEPPEMLDVYLRLLCLGTGDAFLLESVFRSDIWDHLSLPISPENEKAVCDTIIGACDDALDGYVMSEDSGYDGDAADTIGAQRWAMAKGLVDAERDILRRTVQAYKRRAASLDAIEYYAERRLKALDLLRPVDESEIVDAESGARVGRAFDENY